MRLRATGLCHCEERADAASVPVMKQSFPFPSRLLRYARNDSQCIRGFKRGEADIDFHHSEGT